MWNGALYYPYMRVRDTDWLKASALYWDSMRRFKPPHYRLREAPENKLFVEAGFLRPINPAPYAIEVANELLVFMRENTETLRQRFNISNALNLAGPGWGTEGPGRGQRGLGWIHAGKMSYEFSGFLAEQALAQIGRGDDSEWVGVHPTVAAAYMLALAGACAERDSLEPVTDNSSPRISPTQGVEAAVRLLSEGTTEPPHSSEPSYDAAGFAMLAIESVIPRDLERIRPERILEIKSILSEELAEFKTFVSNQRSELERIASIRSEEIRIEAFAAHVNNEITRPLERLERGLRMLGFDTLRSLLTMQTLAPPVVNIHPIYSG